MTNNSAVSQGSLMGLAMVAISTGITQIANGSSNGLTGGIVLVVVGFGFVMWREYLKLESNKKTRSK